MPLKIKEYQNPTKMPLKIKEYQRGRRGSRGEASLTCSEPREPQNPTKSKEYQNPTKMPLKIKESQRHLEVMYST
eukprot:6915978-Pyramimonas_sp.AAC.1